jgi:hypothetical protein
VTDTETLDGADLIERSYGPIARGEYDTALAAKRPALLDYARALPAMTDRELVAATESAIYESALIARFSRMNFNAEHCRATMCHSESRRRQVAAGHDEWCGVGSLYQQAYNAVVCGQGHPGLASVTTECGCGLD